jgi:hypothetical protein
MPAKSVPGSMEAMTIPAARAADSRAAAGARVELMDVSFGAKCAETILLGLSHREQVLHLIWKGS